MKYNFLFFRAFDFKRWFFLLCHRSQTPTFRDYWPRSNQFPNGNFQMPLMNIYKSTLSFYTSIKIKCSTKSIQRRLNELRPTPFINVQIQFLNYFLQCWQKFFDRSLSGLKDCLNVIKPPILFFRNYSYAVLHKLMKLDIFYSSYLMHQSKWQVVTSIFF